MPTLSKKRVSESFERFKEQTIFTHREIGKLINAEQGAWSVRVRSTPKEDRIPIESRSQHKVFEALVSETQLEEIDLSFPYRELKRYTWGHVETYHVIQSVDKDGYFSHYTAMDLNGLTDQVPKTIYFNVEQPATGGGGELTQEGIDRAFKGKCRVSNNSIDFREYKVCKLNGQNTRRLGVVEKELEGSSIWVTDIERTLIDATVRTNYAGGVGEVSNAFKNASKKLSIPKLAKYLRKLNYTYPYHQAIGYYLDRTKNFTNTDLEILKEIPIEFDFYITYQVKNPAYNEDWKLFVPQGF